MSRPEPEQPRPPSPVVTVTGGTARSEAAAPQRHGATALVFVALVVVAAALALVPEPPAPAPPAPVDASLAVVAERIATSQAGVLVVPVEIDNRGPAVAVGDVVLWAEPVRQDPATNGTRRVAAGDRRRFAAIVQPDCTVLTPAAGIAFRATVAVGLRTDQGVRRELVLDLGRDPAVAARVTSLCRPPPPPVATATRGRAAAGRR